MLKRILFTACFTPLFTLGLMASESKNPNILVIMADDAGYNDFGFQGNADYEQVTPNLDRLAARGVRFSQAYVSASVCGPSRAGFITGMNQQRFGFQENFPSHWGEKPHIDWNKGVWQEFGIPGNIKTMGDYLQAEGYTTGVIGKWHLGYSEKFYPTRRGFDYFYGFRSGSRSFFSEPEYNKTDQIPLKWHSIEENGVLVPESEITYVTDNLTEKANAFIDRTLAANEPFFLFLSYNAPHSPYHALDADLAQIAKWFPDLNKRHQTYIAMLYAMDRGIGQVIENLERTGALEDTLIVFLSDNGATAKGPSNNYPLRATKWSPYEGGSRVPMFITWPKVFQSNQLSDEVVSSLDLLPTFLELLGAPRPEVLDGVSLKSHLSGQQAKLPTRTLFWRELTSEGDSLWARVGNYKIIEGSRLDGPLIYNLGDSPVEEDDLAKTNPELLMRLQGIVADWSDSLPAPAWPVYNWRTGKRFSDE